MRVWLDPEKVATRGLTTGDVVNAIREQNVQVAAGQLGAPPSANGANFQLSINNKGRLSDEADFENIIVKTGAGGQLVRLRDVARIELGADNYALRAMIDNRTAVAIPIFQRPGSNAIAVSDAVRAKMAELKKSFPQDIDYNAPPVLLRSGGCGYPARRRRCDVHGQPDSAWRGPGSEDAGHRSQGDRRSRAGRSGRPRPRRACARAGPGRAGTCALPDTLIRRGSGVCRRPVPGLETRLGRPEPG